MRELVFMKILYSDPHFSPCHNKKNLLNLYTTDSTTFSSTLVEGSSIWVWPIRLVFLSVTEILLALHYALDLVAVQLHLLAKLQPPRRQGHAAT
jgi:hypothetical protein